MAKKPHNSSLADQLKPLAKKLDENHKAAEEAERKAKARQKELEEAAARAKEEQISDEERFERAMSGLTRRENIKKFDDSPRALREAREQTAPKKTDEDLFLDAVSAPPPKRDPR